MRAVAKAARDRQCEDNIIYELEMLAAVLAAALWICEETNDLHTHFGDNDAVRFSFVRGSATGEVGQKLMKFHLLLETKSGSWTWYARVPTEANISDYPSTQQHHELLQAENNVLVRAAAELDNILRMADIAGAD